MPSPRLAGLDALRGIAALCVLHFHVMTIFAPQLHLNGKGYLAVDFFFMLSGYVIARTYEQRLSEGFGAGHFIMSRYRRLWPIMAVGALIGAPMLAIELRDPMAFLPVAAASLILIPAVSGAVIYPVNSAAWSILAELSVNLAHGLFFWRWRIRHLLILSASMIPVIVWGAVSWGNLDFGGGADSWPVGIVRALLAYTAGIVLWRWWRDEATVRVSPFLAFAAMPTLLLLLPVLGIKTGLFDAIFVLLACPLLMAGGLAWRQDGPLARWLGMISFPLYAINLPLLHWSNGLGLGPAAGIACALALATYIALRIAPAPRREGSMAGA